MLDSLNMEKISVNSTVQSDPPAQAPVSSNSSFVQTLKNENTMAKNKNVFLPLVIVVVMLGVGTGYVMASATNKPNITEIAAPTNIEGESAGESQAVKVGQVIGAKDASSFKDSAEGVVLAGGLDGEGSHRIVRPGGASQNVYLTSSVMDLKMLEGHKVRVSGETFKAQKAGWLMDVGRAEILELNAPLPDGTQAPTIEEGNE